MIKEKETTHFEGKKALKNTFPQEKNTTMEKSKKKTILFFKNTCWEDFFFTSFFATSYIKLGENPEIPWNKNYFQKEINYSVFKSLLMEYI